MRARENVGEQLVGSSSFQQTRLSGEQRPSTHRIDVGDGIRGRNVPQSRASSTTGVMKSAVTTRARSSSSFHTAASSPVWGPTRSSARLEGTSPRTTRARRLGSSLQAQPAPWLYCVNRSTLSELWSVMS